MKAYDIYIGSNGEEATAHGPSYEYVGLNPADALAKLIADTDLMRTIRRETADLEAIEAFDDDMSAAVHPVDDGCWELHVYIADGDVAITMPPTEYVSITDASDMLDVTRQRVHALLTEGRIDGRMIGSTWMVNRASVEAYASSRASESVESE